MIRTYRAGVVVGHSAGADDHCPCLGAHFAKRLSTKVHCNRAVARREGDDQACWGRAGWRRGDEILALVPGEFQGAETLRATAPGTKAAVSFFKFKKPFHFKGSMTRGISLDGLIRSRERMF